MFRASRFQMASSSVSAKKGKEENTIDNPTNVHPTETYITMSKGGAVVEIPANSLNIFRLK